VELEKIRKGIDDTDKKIIELLGERAALALEAGRIKKQKGLPIFQPGRESEILEMVEKAKTLFPKRSLKRIFQEIITTSRELQQPHTISFLGPVASFTEIAVIKKFGDAKRMPCTTIHDVFTEVEKGKADFGIVPIENSNEGSVSSTLDMFFDSSLKICGEVVINVEQCLLSKSSGGKIKKIFSHPQAFGQCEGWIRKNFPNAELIETSSTSKAAELASHDKSGAAIASPLAAEIYGLKIVARGISDGAINRTRFLVIGKTEPQRTGKDKTSIMFATKHEPGALFRALKSFYDCKLNMTKIESRPIKGRLWEYAFFVDFQGHHTDVNPQKALRELTDNSLFVKMLGSYPEESVSS
jgi:chorismate mutase/prephenate dehydratase